MKVINGIKEYYLPKRGKVTKEASKELYYLCKDKGVIKSKELTGLLIDCLLHNKQSIAEFTTTWTATMKQINTLWRCIYGRHYSIETYMFLINYLDRIEPLKEVRKEKKREEDISSTIDIKTDTIKEDNPRRRKADSPTEYYKQAITFLTDLARHIDSKQAYDFFSEDIIRMTDQLPAYDQLNINR